jgi:alkaline phosphatase D
VEREIVLSTANNSAKNWWCWPVTRTTPGQPLTLMNGSVVGHEFATPASARQVLRNTCSTAPRIKPKQIFMGVVNDLRYADTSRRGFMLMSFTPTEAKGTWYFVSTVKSRTYTVDASASQSDVASTANQWSLFTNMTYWVSIMQGFATGE